MHGANYEGKRISCPDIPDYPLAGVLVYSARAAARYAAGYWLWPLCHVWP